MPVWTTSCHDEAVLTDSRPAAKARIGGCRLDYIGRAPAQAGGRRSESAPGLPGSSVIVRHYFAADQPRRGECLRDYMGLQCRRFESGRALPVAQRSEHEAMSRSALSPRRFALSV